MESSDPQALTFGPFRLLPSQGTLFEGRKPVRLGRRALGILTVLVERAGTLVPKEELAALVWSDTSVEEGSLRVHIAALRKVLGDGQAGRRYIENVSGRGYRLVTPVERESADAPASIPAASEHLRQLPALLVSVVGRASIVQALLAQLSEYRFATIVAPGGMGKTTVALAAAERAAPLYDHGARFIDLAPLTDPNLVPCALASALTLPATSVSRAAQIHGFLADKRMLLVMDNCEQVVGAAAQLIEGVLRAAPGVHVIATSREPLQAEGERIVRLPSLESPAPSSTLSLEAALAFPAIELFVHHASTRSEALPFSEAEVSLVAEICRRLDGNPLAIELAASGAAFLGVRELAARLDVRLSLLTKGRRTAPPRQRTLRATLDWSHDTLSETERVVLRRLSVFKGNFALESALAVAADASITASDVVDAVMDLSSKSMLLADASGDSVRHRLLETTREYAAEKAAAAGEQSALARRHAEHHRDLFERVELELEAQAQVPDAWSSVHGWQIDDVRAALDWSFAAGGDAPLGAALTAATIPLWFQACRMDEYRSYVERALETVRAAPTADRARETKLSLALAHLLLHTVGLSAQSYALIERALALSEPLSPSVRMHALWSAWFIEMARANYAVALVHAEAFGELSSESSELAANLLLDRMLALSLYYLGQPRGARVHLERVLRVPVAGLRVLYMPVSHVDPRVSMQATLACTLWLQGFPEQALRLARESVARAVQLSHPTSVCHALVYGACPVAFWTGSSELAREWVAALAAEASRASLGYWLAWGRSFEAALFHHDPSPGLGSQGATASHDFMQREVLATVAEGLLDDQMIARAENGDIEWCAAEITRARGARLLEREAAEERAEALFSLALELARRQGALSWELRSAISLARLWRARGRARDAHELLFEVFQRFTEGFGTADLVAARLLLSELES